MPVPGTGGGGRKAGIRITGSTRVAEDGCFTSLACMSCQLALRQHASQAAVHETSLAPGLDFLLVDRSVMSMLSLPVLCTAHICCIRGHSLVANGHSC